MVDFFKKFRRRILVFLAVLGPGIITAISDNDAGGVATYSIIGAKFGYSMLFLLLLITFLLAITQEMGARMAIVTGKGLGDLIRERYGIKVSLFVFLSLVLANLGSTIANFAGLKAGLGLFNLSNPWFFVFFIFLMIFSVYKGSYQTNQKIFLGASFLYIAYVFSAILAKPNWIEALKNLVTPMSMVSHFSNEYIFAAIALLGTTITPWGQFFIQSYILDKKLTLDKLKYERLEVFIGAFLTDFFSFFMIVAVAATLYVNKITINGAAEAALAITPFAGSFASILFGAGLIIASYMGGIIIPLTTSYAFAEFFGYEGSLDSPVSRGRLFYLIFVIQIIVGFFIVLLPGISLFKIVLYTQSLNGILLPVIIYFLLKFANNRELMGEHKNNKFYNYFAIISSIVIVAASLFLLIGGIFGKI